MDVRLKGPFDATCAFQSVLVVGVGRLYVVATVFEVDVCGYQVVMAVEDFALARHAVSVFFPGAAVGGELVAEVGGVFLLSVVEGLHQEVAHAVVPVAEAAGKRGVALFVECNDEGVGALIVRKVETMVEGGGIVVCVDQALRRVALSVEVVDVDSFVFVLTCFSVHYDCELAFPSLFHAAHGSVEAVNLEVGDDGQPDGVGEVVAHLGGVGGWEGVAQGAGDLDAASFAVAQAHGNPAGARAAAVAAGWIPSRNGSHRRVDGRLPVDPQVNVIVRQAHVVHLALLVDAEADGQASFLARRGWGKGALQVGAEAVDAAGVGGREHVDYCVAGVAEQRVHRERAEEKRPLALVVVLVVVFGLAVRRQRQQQGGEDDREYVRCSFHGYVLFGGLCPF